MTHLSFDSLANLVATRFRINESRISPDSTFDDLGLDSLSQIELVMALKKDMDIHLTDDQIAEMATLSDVVAKVNSLQ
ncbi:MAG: acyl carrier protein [Alphaproteobacteria bacterium]|jgi:acyl carrier protein|nr:acyl carrier protein [Alphaproteobacteria bacterium]MBU1550101.1 acyl carrier protein [Alphaproteobacteria bacterium]MBU2337097.1 acyl carrier protein [Alphaproteobacteria bacterium]MBU2389428.1 acyl carrier protein [Alphaproteobacteria bacterium]